MIDLEVAESENGERKSLLIAMANVRGFLGDARTRFRNATAIVQPQNRHEFEEAWREYEDRLDTLTSQRDLLSAPQRMSFDQFREAHDVYAENVISMIRVLYPVDTNADAPTAREVVP